MTAAQTAAIAALQAAGASAYLIELARKEFDAAVPPPPPPPPTTEYTTAQIKALGATKVMDISIPASGFTKYLTSRGDGMRDGARGLSGSDVLVIVFKAPAADPVFVFTALGEINQPSREWSLSEYPCDWTSTAIYRATGGDAAPAVNLTMATVRPNGARYTLEGGRVYYVSVRARDPSGTANWNLSVAPANPRP